MRLAWLVAVLFCASMFGITGWRVLHARHLELDESRVTTANLARSVADHARGVVDDSSIVLADLVERLEADGVSGAALDRMHRLLVARVASTATIHHLVVFSAQGDALTTSFEPMLPVNVADRAYFIHHRDHPAGGEMIGPAVRNRGDGHWSLTVSRRFEQPGGGFGGVVVGIVDCNTFATFYASLNLGEHGSITLVHDSQTIIVRHPEPPDPEYRRTRASQSYWDRKAGSGRYTSSLDGVRRLYSFQRVEDMPLVAIVALAEQDVLAAWRRDAWVAFAVCSVVSGMLGLLGWALVRQIRQGEQREIALERSEQRYRLLAEHSTDVIIHFGPDSRRVYVSPACERLFGYRPAEMLFGHPRDITHPDDWPALRDTLADILSNGYAEPITYRVRHKSGRYVWVEVLGQKLDGAGGLIAAVRDATHRKKAETRLLEEITAREAVQVQLAHARRMEALGHLAGGMAHDFNNVLQAVHGGARLIASRPADADHVRRLAQMVAEAAERGASVTKRLLAFSRRGDLRAEAVDPAALLSGMLEMFEHTLGDGIEAHVQAEPRLPPLLADKGQLETVLVNLATNARDAMPDGGLLTSLVPLAALPCDAGLPPGKRSYPALLGVGAYIRLSVRDSGRGMTPEVLARVAEPFFTTKPQGKGTGLGLSMAKGFAEQSGGAFAIESTPGRGTTVVLWLPMATEPGARSASSGKVAGPPCRDRVARILLVDDDRLVREIIAEQMTDLGYDVLTASSGMAALTLLDMEGGIDVIVSDLSMPGMNGVAVIREAQRRVRGLPAILLTGFATDEAELETSDPLTGKFSLLQKPIESRVLADRVSTMLTEAVVDLQAH